MVAIIAAVAAVRQAGEAQKSRRAAEKQAQIAEQQLQLLRGERDQRDAPKFAIEVVDREIELGFFAAQVTLRLEHGPALSEVTAVITGDYVNNVEAPGAHESDRITFAGLRPGGTETFHVACDDGNGGSTIHIDLVSAERDGDRTWSEHRTLTIPKPPRASRIW
ncbi:hypothetical protein ILP97_00915 [Amycolatopsis sp. H6(2020)]|nr:hypothetical protein [Amycolatopsis sp. H6(2020)]